MDQNIYLQDLPNTVFTTIIDYLVLGIGIQKSVRLRCVSSEILLAKSRSPITTEKTYLAKCAAAIASVNETLDRLTQPTTVERRNEQHGLIAEAAGCMYFPHQPAEEVTTLDLLCGAVVLGNLPLVKSFRNSANIDSKSIYFGRPLRLAAAWGHTHIVRYLLDSGADLDAIKPSYNQAPVRPHVYRAQFESPLCAAVLGGHEEIVHLLLEPELQLPKYTYRQAILAGVRGGHIHLCQLLAPSGFHGLEFYMLKEAVLHNQQAFVQVLLDSGVDVNTGCQPIPLYIAAMQGSVPMVRFLLERGADDTTTSHHKQPEPGSWPMYHGLRSTWTGPGPHAANYGHQEVVEIFLERGARPSSIFEAAVVGSQTHLVEWLLTKYPNLLGERRENGRNLGLHSLWSAIALTSPRLISILVHAGVPLNDANYEFWEKPIITAKTMATQRARTEVVTAKMLAEDWIVKCLLSLGAKDEDADQEFYTKTYEKYVDEHIFWWRPEGRFEEMTSRTCDWVGKY
ncbi:hypothetical protein Hte_008784 [Hypoxylon texense]